jgi:hypothetical protein
MDQGRAFVNRVSHRRLLFVLFLMAFQKDDFLCPYFLFFNEWMSHYEQPVRFDTPHPVTCQTTWFHFSSNKALQYKISIEGEGTFAHGCSVWLTDANNNDQHWIYDSATEFVFHLSNFYIEFRVPPQISRLSSVWGCSITISPVVDLVSFSSASMSVCYREFINQMKIMNRDWRPDHDELLSPHVKLTNIIESLPATSAIRLNCFPRSLIEMRFSFIKKLNELFNGELNSLPLNDTNQPLVNLIIPASSGFSSAMKLSRLEKIICKNFNQKKSFSFNRSRALLAKTHPDSPEAKSLFDQVVEQIPTSSLTVLKCKDAPWRVNLEGEGATDVGGPGRDLFTEVSSEICLPHNHLFVCTPRAIEEKTMNEFIPDIRCKRRERFIYVGAFIALAFVTRLQQPYKFASLIWAYLAGKKVTIEHICEIDPQFKSYLESVEKADFADLHWTVPNILGEQIELIINGSNLVVSSKERGRYSQLAKEYRMNEFNPLLKKMKEGFGIFLSNICAFMVTPDELKSFICGSVGIPIRELKQLIQITNATPNEEKMLFDVLEEFTVEERMLFIKFATGKMSVPAPGASWNGCLNVEFVKLKPKLPPYRLPVAATCSSTVSIPRYPSKDVLAEKLRTAITYGSDIVLDHAFDAGGIIE